MFPLIAMKTVLYSGFWNKGAAGGRTNFIVTDYRQGRVPTLQPSCGEMGLEGAHVKSFLAAVRLGLERTRSFPLPIQLAGYLFSAWKSVIAFSVS